jgi:hypothetical protein
MTEKSVRRSVVMSLNRDCYRGMQPVLVSPQIETTGRTRRGAVYPWQCCLSLVEQCQIAVNNGHWANRAGDRHPQVRETVSTLRANEAVHRVSTNYGHSDRDQPKSKIRGLAGFPRRMRTNKKNGNHGEAPAAIGMELENQDKSENQEKSDSQSA